MAGEIAIHIRDLTKQYPSNRQAGKPVLTSVLKNVSIQVREGERWGIIGRNGSGKSTLLKILSGIVKPTMGWIEIRGTLNHILSVGDNFIAELTGRENMAIFFQLHGFSKKESLAAIEQTAAFADIGTYFDEAVKNYSSGMYLRIAFAACLQLSADILLVDEIFSVGDAAFREKIKLHFKEKLAQAGTLLLVSHNPEEVVEFCTHCIWLEKGEVKMQGEVQKVETAYYYEMLQESSELKNIRRNDSVHDGENTFAGAENEFIKIVDFEVSPVPGDGAITYNTGACFTIRAIKKQTGITLHPQIIIYDYLMRPIVEIVAGGQVDVQETIADLQDTVGEIKYQVRLPRDILTLGNFYAELHFGKNYYPAKEDLEEVICVPEKIPFEVKQGLLNDFIGGNGHVFVKPLCDWDIRKL